jgi:hypothetical protein
MITPQFMMARVKKANLCPYRSQHGDSIKSPGKMLENSPSTSFSEVRYGTAEVRTCAQLSAMAAWPIGACLLSLAQPSSLVIAQLANKGGASRPFKMPQHYELCPSPANIDLD